VTSKNCTLSIPRGKKKKKKKRERRRRTTVANYTKDPMATL
jgi:hypothetical protein